MCFVCLFFSNEGVNRLWILVCQLPGLYTLYLKSGPSALGVSLPSPMAYCTQRLSVLWFALPHHMTSLKVPPPSSLFISSKLFEMRGVSQSKTSFPSTTACQRICQRGLRSAFFRVHVCVHKIPDKFESTAPLSLFLDRECNCYCNSYESFIFSVAEEQASQELMRWPLFIINSTT